MDAKRAKQLLPIIQAFAEGKTIQCRHNTGGRYMDVDITASFHDGIDYRIKPDYEELTLTHQQILDYWWRKKDSNVWRKITGYAVGHNRPYYFSDTSYCSYSTITKEELAKDWVYSEYPPEEETGE